MYKGKLIVFIIVLGGLCTFNSRAQMVSINARLDTNDILIGDKVNLTLEAIKPKEAQLEFPVLGNQLSMGVEITDSSDIVTEKYNEEQDRMVQDVEIMVFDTGMFLIPQLDFVLKTKDYSDTIRSSASYLQVHGVAIDTTGTIRDIKPIDGAPYSIGEVLPYLLIAILLAALVFGYFYYRKRKKENQPLFKTIKPKEPADIIALRELDKLKAEKVWQQGDIKNYYTRLTNIIRTYIEDKFLIKALEQTTEEILKEVKKSPFAALNYEQLSSLLNLADLVKFAKGVPEPDENVQHLDNAYTFINNTRRMGEDDGEESNDVKQENAG